MQVLEFDGCPGTSYKSTNGCTLPSDRVPSKALIFFYLPRSASEPNGFAHTELPLFHTPEQNASFFFPRNCRMVL